MKRFGEINVVTATGEVRRPSPVLLFYSFAQRTRRQALAGTCLVLTDEFQSPLSFLKRAHSPPRLPVSCRIGSVQAPPGPPSFSALSCEAGPVKSTSLSWALLPLPHFGLCLSRFKTLLLIKSLSSRARWLPLRWRSPPRPCCYPASPRAHVYPPFIRLVLLSQNSTSLPRSSNLSLVPLLSLVQFPAPFRRGRSWQLGPVLITEPLFMEVDHLADVVHGYDPAEGPIVGAVGHDLFHFATVFVSTNAPPWPRKERRGIHTASAPSGGGAVDVGDFGRRMPSL
jgi:hypothetical protein